MADYPRRSVRPQNAPAFSLALPPGLIAVTGAEANEFITTIGGAPLIAGIVAVNGPADVAITFGSSEPIADGFKPITVDGERFRHAAFVRKASENVDGEEVRIVTMIVFDGAHAFHLTARCPQSIWSDYGPFLEDAMTSFELEAPEEKKPAPPRPIVDDGRKAVLEQVERLIGAGRFDDADRAAKAIPDSLQRDAALGRLYVEALKRAAEAGDVARAEALFAKARPLQLFAFPDPHTAVEAERFEAARAEAEAELQTLLEQARRNSGA